MDGRRDISAAHGQRHTLSHAHVEQPLQKITNSSARAQNLAALGHAIAPDRPGE